MHHHQSIIFRREYQQLKDILQRSTELLAPLGSYNGADMKWRLYNKKVIDFGAVQKESDIIKYQGRGHDLVGFDEITHFSENQFRWLIAWNRSTRPNQRVRVVCTGNPPTDAMGDWVIKYWGPWLDPIHPNPAALGELRWYSSDSLSGADIERPNGEPFDQLNELTGEIETVEPVSRTFIRSWLRDNPYLAKTKYMARLQALQEPLRSKMLLGDFSAGRVDDSSQVVPTAWVLAAQQRWTEERPGWLEALGVDVARGGQDKTVISPRSGGWMGHQMVIPGTNTPDGSAVLRHIINAIPTGHFPGIQIDGIGVGASVVDLAKLHPNLNVISMISSNRSNARDKSGYQRFSNKRAEWWWKFREMLDPESEDEPVALPPDRELLADLTAPRWNTGLGGIQIESKDDIRQRIKRSTDKGDSCVYAYALPTLPPMLRLI